MRVDIYERIAGAQHGGVHRQIVGACGIVRRVCSVCLYAVCFLFILALAVPQTAEAAKQTSLKVKVNNTYTATMVKKGTDWYLQAEEFQEGSQDEPLENGQQNAVSPSGVQYLKITQSKELSSGYYYFYKDGRLDLRKRFHSLDTKVNGKRFLGEYYFGYDNGRLYNKKGWLTLGNKKYYLSSSGRKYKNCWKSGYYLKGNGEIAKNMKTPDGFYVDCDGRKCAKAEMRLSGLKKSLNSMISGYSGRWSVYVKNLRTGDVLSINNSAMYPASVIKLFTMEAVYEQIRKGSLKKTSYVSSLLNQMITVSDNEAFNALVRMTSKSGSFTDGCRTINQYLKKQGYTNTECHNTLHPSSSVYTSDGSKNKASAKTAGILLEQIYQGKCVSPKYSKEMLNLLLKQTRRWKIPAGLPSGTKVANKTGETDDYQHDAAIVYGPKTDYVVCIFSQTGEYNGINGIKKLSAKIYDYLN